MENNKISWQYIAGYFDGEGCLTFNIGQGRKDKTKGNQIDGWGIHPILTIETCDYEVIERIKKFLIAHNIHFNYYKRRDEHYLRKRIDRIYLHGENIKKFIKNILPFSIGKYPQLKLYQQFLKIKDTGWEKSRRGKRIWTKKNFIKAIKIVEKLDSYKKCHRRKLTSNYFKNLWNIK